MKNGHAKFSPSAAKRWMSCSGSVYLSRFVPEPKSSEFADEGSRAHGLGEKCLRSWLADEYTLEEAFSKFSSEADNEEMKGHVWDYLEVVIGLITKFRPYSVLIEQKVKFSDDIWGTADVILFYKKKGKTYAVIIDLKYGQGVVVEVKDNPQLAVYGCALNSDPQFDDVAEVDCYIFQPRCEHVDGPLRHWNMKGKDLTHWQQDIFLAANEAMQQDKAESPKYTAGGHCRWCPAIAICKTHAAYEHGEAGIDFEVIGPENAEEMLPDVGRITDEQISRIVLARADIEKFLKRCEEYAANKIKAGDRVPGLKIVYGRSNRKWFDNSTEETAEKLIEMGMEDPFRPEQLVTITDAERALTKIHGKNKAKELLDGICDKTVPSEKVVSENDPRPAIATPEQSAFVDFTEVKE